ncbi:hypothetical protein ARMSODRAFT_957381 [Armillaria solidipes]|uniref:Uncharacterized protein n=1 Tax=Armillaria solidipes TaxID=1076256 RepID=A0A2H3BWW5_9AGAR|nr:hypothetical protein ARMSODRAFT_957381 [Armillaria solidipes]
MAETVFGLFPRCDAFVTLAGECAYGAFTLNLSIFCLLCSDSVKVSLNRIILAPFLSISQAVSSADDSVDKAKESTRIFSEANIGIENSFFWPVSM